MWIHTLRIPTSLSTTPIHTHQQINLFPFQPTITSINHLPTIFKVNISSFRKSPNTTSSQSCPQSCPQSVYRTFKAQSYNNHKQYCPYKSSISHHKHPAMQNLWAVNRKLLEIRNWKCNLVLVLLPLLLHRLFMLRTLLYWRLQR